jgi:hypothetical protein
MAWRLWRPAVQRLSNTLIPLEIYADQRCFGAITELNDVWDIFSIEGLDLQSRMKPNSSKRSIINLHN